MRKYYQKRREERRRGIYVLPNLITTASLFCGFYSIVMAINGDYIQSAWAILFAGIFDLLDGRVARLTHTHSDFGTQYDSLCDLASFGLAPAVLAYTWTLNQFGKFGWGAAFLFFACGALRLARYNVQLSDEEKKNFQGLPIPLAAYAIAGYVLYHHAWKGDVQVASYLTLMMAVGFALLMVSSIRYPSFKTFNFGRKASFLILVTAAVMLFIVASSPSTFIFLFTMFYIGAGLVNQLILSLRKRQLFGLKGLTGPEGVAEEPEPFRVIDGEA